MNLRALSEMLRQKFGTRSDPDTWWPIYFGRTEPRAFERVLTNILVSQSQWASVRPAVEALDRAELLTAKGLAEADEVTITASVTPVGFQKGKAQCLKAVATFVVSHFGTEAAFCAGVTREQLLTIQGVGPETADRILLYPCGKLVWPVDTYCFRAFARYGIIAAVPQQQAEKKCLAADIKRMVEEQIPWRVEDWQRLHALMQLEGEDVRAAAKAPKKTAT